MTDSELLRIYVGLVPFLSEVCGPGTEIAVHDISNPEHSLVAIGNNVSGRQIGNPLTDLAKELADKGAYSDADYISNYEGHSKDKDFLSSTFYIKNKGRLIGMLCINKDMSIVSELSISLKGLLERFNLALPQESEFSEDLENPVTNIMRTQISETIAQSGVIPARMSRQEKIRIVHQLNENGVMLLRGAAAEIAKQLGISVPSVYRYLNTHTDSD